MKKTCFVIVGPTAVGKTAMAVSLAKYFSTQIISADSRQCFKELNIGVAKPSPEEIAAVPHYFINSHSVHQTVNAAVFEEYALEKVNEIFAGHEVAVMVGGTGLYIKTFCSGIDEVPVVLPGIRENIIAAYNENGLEWLQQEIQQKDPLYFSKGEIQNPQRLLRALEVMVSSGKSIIEFQTQKRTVRDFKIIKIGLTLPREELYGRINNRVDAMIAEGLTDEVKSLLPYQNLNALQTVGYKEIFDYFAGKVSLDEAVSAIKINTRHYAKRQMTWFNKDKEVNWCAPDLTEILKKASELLIDNG